MSSLYEISEDLLRIFNDIENNDGEVTDEQYNELCIRREELNTKIDNYVKAVKEFQKDADFIKDEKKRLNDKQNVYKNRVERLKTAIITAVEQFGENGKTNKFIELPTVRVSTKNNISCEINEERVNIFLTEFTRLIRELVSNGILYTGENIDMQGLLDTINANIIAEQGNSFEPFKLSDLYCINIEIRTTNSIAHLLTGNGKALELYGIDPIRVDIKSDIDKKITLDKIKYDFTDDNKPTITKIVNSKSLLIK